jgi:hypothetical protein
VTQTEALGHTDNIRARIRSASQNKDVVMNRFLSAALLSCAAASLSNPAWSFQGFDLFQQIKQSIECVRKPNTDYLTCTNKTVDSEEEDTTSVSNPGPPPEPEGRYYFSEPSELVIPEQYFPEVQYLAPTLETMGPPAVNVGAITVEDFDLNGLDDVVIQMTWGKGRSWTDPEVCGGITPWGSQSTCFDNLDHEEENWNESWASVVFILQKEPGVWEVGNRELFGFDVPTFGYSGILNGTFDVNNDGYPDYLRSGGWEDGRPPANIDPDDRWSPSNWLNAPQKAMISNGDGTLRIEDTGITGALTARVAKMQNGQWHAIYCTGRISDRYWREPDLTFTYQGIEGIRLGEGLMPAQVRTWYNGEQEVVEDYPWLSCGDFRVTEPEEINGEVYSRYLIDSHSKVGWDYLPLDFYLDNREKYDDVKGKGDPGLGFHFDNYKDNGGEGFKKGFVLYEQIDSQWVEVDTYVWGTEGGYLSFYDSADRTLKGDDRPINTWPVIDYGDTWGLGISASYSCTIKMYPDGDPIFIYVFDGLKIPKDTPEPVDFNLMPEIDATTYTYRAFGVVDGKLTEIDLWPEGDTSSAGRAINCADINGDGYDDLSAMSSPFWEAAPPEFVVWLNDQNGGLVKTKVQVDNPDEDFTNGIDINAEAELGEASEYYGQGFGDQVITDVNGDGIGDLISYERSGGLGSDPSEYPKFKVHYGINPQEIASP